jgi:hypothetical protein
VYQQGLAVATTIFGAGLPAAMRASASPITVLNLNGEATSAPLDGFTLYDFKLFDRALSAAAVLDDYLNLTNRELTP